MLRERVILHLDVDCFYAQAEILQRPWLQDRPVGITQKFLVVTSNYVARNLGVPKMVPIDEAKRRCPDMVLINGEDLTPYRAASKSLMEVFKRFGPLERRGLDECAVDITEEVHRRAETGSISVMFSGFVLGLVEDQRISDEEHLLMLGTQVAAEVRRAAEQETGLQCSCGIAQNKMLAKMACSLNKPNKQTCILPSAVQEFLRLLPVRKIPGVGRQTEEILKEMDIRTLEDLLKPSLPQLSCKLGDKTAHLLFDACRGRDNTPVKEKGYQKSVSVEDSFKPCTAEQAKKVLHYLAPDLIARLDEDREDTGRRPKTFTVKWKSRGVWKSTSSSTYMPVELLSSNLAVERRIDVLVETAMKLLVQSVQGRQLCVLNIGATNFITTLQALGASGDIRTYIRTPAKSAEAAKSLETALAAEGDREVEAAHSGLVSEKRHSANADDEGKPASDMVFHQHSNGREVSGSPAAKLCDSCGEALDSDEALQVHIDHHLALELQASETRHSRQQQPQQTQKRFRRNSTLDSFVLRSKS